ncbi:hypothetical protein PAMP_002683 [Pampus punctatissimus]
MKLIQETEDGTNDRKFIKSQVEKRRRERMNRSLERLRTMLLQQPQQLGGTHRVEKTEILEQTVLFLQNTAKEDNTRAGGGGQKHSFQDGFSTCLQKATQFLGPEGKGLWLGAALNASFSARFARSDSESAGTQKRTEAQSSTSLPHTKSILRMLKQKSKHRLHTCAFGVNNSFTHPYQLPVQQGFPTIPQQPQTHSQFEISVERRAIKQSLSQSLPVWDFRVRGWESPMQPLTIHLCAIMSAGINYICDSVIGLRTRLLSPSITMASEVTHSHLSELDAVLADVCYFPLHM